MEMNDMNMLQLFADAGTLVSTPSVRKRYEGFADRNFSG